MGFFKCSVWLNSRLLCTMTSLKQLYLCVFMCYQSKQGHVCVLLPQHTEACELCVINLAAFALLTKGLLVSGVHSWSILKCTHTHTHTHTFSRMSVSVWSTASPPRQPTPQGHNTVRSHKGDLEGPTQHKHSTDRHKHKCMWHLYFHDLKMLDHQGCVYES